VPPNPEKKIACALESLFFGREVGNGSREQMFIQQQAASQGRVSLARRCCFFPQLLSCHFFLLSWLYIKGKEKLVPMAIITGPLLRDD